MSRSFKKTPITGNTRCESEKQDKRMASRIVRRSIKQILQSHPYEYTHIDRRTFRFNNIWSFGKDGKNYYGSLEYWSPEYYRQMMRK